MYPRDKGRLRCVNQLMPQGGESVGQSSECKRAGDCASGRPPEPPDLRLTYSAIGDRDVRLKGGMDCENNNPSAEVVLGGISPEHEELLAQLSKPENALRCLSCFSRSMLRQNTVEDLVWDIAGQAGRLLRFEDCVLYLCEPHGLVQAAAFGVKNPRRHEIQSPIVIAYGDGIVGTVAVTGRAERIGDVRLDPRYIVDEFAGLSELAIPIIFEDQIIGVLDSESSRLDGFTAEDEALATAVASIAAPRIATARAAEECSRAEQALLNIEQEHLQREEQLRAERLESLGVLAGGIAHDFNNLLTAIIGNLCLAQLEPTAAENGELLAEAERACERASKLTQQLLTFSKGGTPVKESADLGELLEESVQFALRGFNVALELEVDAGLETLALDRDQVSHVFHNLVLNAVQAMGGVGQLKVEARLPAGGAEVLVSFTDEGPGVPEELRGRIFEPYFTTREEGNGMGLASAYSIVRRHGGRLVLEPGDGGGACFSVYLPAAAGEVRQGQQVSELRPVAPAHILVLDDDDAARTAIVRMLESLGHRVESVPEGSLCIEAFEQAFRGHNPFDLVVMDLAIPGGLGGREAIRRLRAIHPGVRAIVASGYADDPILSQPEHFGFMGRLRKPFRLAELEREVGRVLRG